MAFIQLTRRVSIASGMTHREVDLPMLVNPAHIVVAKKMGQGHTEIVDVSGHTYPVKDAFEAVVVKLGEAK